MAVIVTVPVEVPDVAAGAAGAVVPSAQATIGPDATNATIATTATNALLLMSELEHAACVGWQILRQSRGSGPSGQLARWAVALAAGSSP